MGEWRPAICRIGHSRDVQRLRVRLRPEGTAAEPQRLTLEDGATRGEHHLMMSVPVIDSGWIVQMKK